MSSEKKNIVSGFSPENWKKAFEAAERSLQADAERIMKEIRKGESERKKKSQDEK